MVEVKCFSNELRTTAFFQLRGRNNAGGKSFVEATPRLFFLQNQNQKLSQWGCVIRIDLDRKLLFVIFLQSFF